MSFILHTSQPLECSSFASYMCLIFFSSPFCPLPLSLFISLHPLLSFLQYLLPPTPLSPYPHSQTHPLGQTCARVSVGLCLQLFSHACPWTIVLTLILLTPSVAVHRCPEAHFLSSRATGSGLHVRCQLGRCAQQTASSRLYSQCEYQS